VTASKSSSARTSRREKPQLVADELRDLIISGTLAEGDSLGTEGQLLERFDVSRPTLREALRILQAEGVISVARGVQGGVVVRLPDQRLVARATALVLQAQSVAISDVFDAYAVIEPAAARMVATSAARTAAGTELRRLVLDQKRWIDEPVRFTLARKQFHEDLVRLAGNQTLLMTVAVLNEVIERSVTEAVRMAVHEPASSRHAGLRAQEQLIDLIVDGNGDGAQAHWSNYLTSVRPHLLGNGGTAIVDLDDHR